VNEHKNSKAKQRCKKTEYAKSDVLVSREGRGLGGLNEFGESAGGERVRGLFRSQHLIIRKSSQQHFSPFYKWLRLDVWGTRA
jgi:hypothetical protein